MTPTKRFITLAVVGFALAAPATPVRAATIFNNGPPTLSFPGYFSDFNTPQQIAEDFGLLPGLSTISGAFDLWYVGRSTSRNKERIEK